MCSEIDFIQGKDHFNPTTKITIAPYCLLLLCHKMAEYPKLDYPTAVQYLQPMMVNTMTY